MPDKRMDEALDNTSLQSRYILREVKLDKLEAFKRMEKGGRISRSIFY